MAEFVNAQVKERFLEEKDPIIELNTSCQIQSFNEFTAQLFNITDQENCTLQLDELSKTRWDGFVNRLRKQVVSYCNLKIKIGDSPYKDVKFIGHFNEKENLITAKILVHAPENSQIAINNEIFYSLFNEITHGVIISDVDGIIIDVNDMALQYLSYKRADIIHLSHENLLNAFAGFEYQKYQYLTKLRSSGSATMEISKANKLGEESYYKIETKFNFLTKKLVTTITDITETTRLKQQLERQSQLCSVGEMAASITHEIRNPMTSLKGFVDLMKMNANNDDYKKYLQIMDSELERMDTILSELLNLSKPTNKKVEELSIYKVLNDVIELMQQSAVKNNSTIQLNIEQDDLRLSKIIGNEVRLKQLFINLIKNAIEVMNDGGMITVELARTDRNNIQVSVRDEGIGMTDDETQQLFTPFYTTKESGTGLGLALVKKVVEEHHASIKVESAVRVGTTFIIDFPVCTCESHCDHERRFIDIRLNNSSVKLPVV